MGKIDDMMTPKANWVKCRLGDCFDVLRGKRLTKKQLDDTNKYPVYHGGLEPIGFYDQCNRDKGTVMIINVGASAGTIGYCDQDFWSSDGCFCLSKNEKINSKFVYYFLLSNGKIIKSKVRVAGIPTLDSSAIRDIDFCYPPLEVQEEIVSVLDHFSQLQSELEEELLMREKQFEYYRELLLTPKNDWKECKLGEIGMFVRGNGILKSDFVDEGFPCIHYGQVHTYYGTSTNTTRSFVSESYSKKLRKAKYGDLIIATTSEDVKGCCKSVVWLGDNEVAISGDSYLYSHNQNPLYMAYLFQSNKFAEQKALSATGAKVVRVSGSSMADFSFSFPPIDEQKRIVGILDKFDKLINDKNEGLQKEIELRKKQYEYYRNKLLTF